MSEEHQSPPNPDSEYAGRSLAKELESLENELRLRKLREELDDARSQYGSTDSGEDEGRTVEAIKADIERVESQLASEGREVVEEADPQAAQRRETAYEEIQARDSMDPAESDYDPNQ